TAPLSAQFRPQSAKVLAAAPLPRSPVIKSIDSPSRRKSRSSPPVARHPCRPDLGRRPPHQRQSSSLIVAFSSSSGSSSEPVVLQFISNEQTNRSSNQPISAPVVGARPPPARPSSSIAASRCRPPIEPASRRCSSSSSSHRPRLFLNFRSTSTPLSVFVFLLRVCSWSSSNRIDRSRFEALGLFGYAAGLQLISD
ncbi:Os09g0550300, partial [Oryza sativa Japonica Group]